MSGHNHLMETMIPWEQNENRQCTKITFCHLHVQNNGIYDKLEKRQINNEFFLENHLTSLFLMRLVWVKVENFNHL